MKVGMIGLGRMGAGLVRRLIRGGHECVAHDRDPSLIHALTTAGATAALSLDELVAQLPAPRVVWVMVPAAAMDNVLADLVPLLGEGDIIIDGGNTHYRDDIARAARVQEHGIHYVDCGTSGGVFGEERGYCLMIGGEREIVERLDPVFDTLAPGVGSVPRTPGAAERHATAERGYLHCGPTGAGHFVKMVHNGIEYGMMAAFAEGFNILKQAGAGRAERAADAETAPLRNPEFYQYEFDLADISEVWRRGSVVSSWLLDLTAAALAGDPDLEEFEGRVSDSGEGRWTVEAAVDEGVPAHVLSAALFARFSSRGGDAFQNKVLSAMRYGFGGHLEPPGGRGTHLAD